MVTEAVRDALRYSSLSMLKSADLRFEDVLEAEAPLLLSDTDERVQTLKRVCDRLVTAMDAQGLVSAAIWPRDGRSSVEKYHNLAKFPTDADILHRLRQFEARTLIKPSARTDSMFLPYKPESSNPQKIIEGREWDLFVIDMPSVNAFVLREALRTLF
jgi:hypothetical protein